MKKNDPHDLGSALELLVGAAEAYANELPRDAASAEWRKQYVLHLALESARRALSRHRVTRASAHRPPADVLLNLRER